MFIDSYSYLCEAWRRGNISPTEQIHWLAAIQSIYSNQEYSCSYLLNQYYPGAPIFSRTSFIYPLSFVANIHPLFGPLVLNFVVQILLIYLIYKTVCAQKNIVLIAIIFFFANPSLVYPLFAFSTEKFQITFLLMLVLLIKNKLKFPRSHFRIYFYATLIWFLFLRENILWGIWISLLLVLQSKRHLMKTDAVQALFVALISFISYLVSKKVAYINTPSYITEYSGGRAFTESEAVRRVFSSEIIDLIHHSIVADLNIFILNLSVFDVSTFIFAIIIFYLYLRYGNMGDYLLLISAFMIGIFQCTISAAFFKDQNMVTFFRLLLPSIFIIIVCNPVSDLSLILKLRFEKAK